MGWEIRLSASRKGAAAKGKGEEEEEPGRKFRPKTRSEKFPALKPQK